MSLINLVQLICLEKQSAALILSKEQEEKGIIYFNQGEIIEASAGNLRGEDAVLEILTWTEGKFRLSSDVLLPRRTITTSWDRILSVGRRRIDEMQIDDDAITEREEDLTSNEIEHDNALELDLIYLLSKLEHSRASLTEKDKQNQPAVVLTIFSSIVSNITEMAEKHILGDILEEVLATKGTSSSGLDLLQVKKDLISEERLEKDQYWQGDRIIFREAYFRIGSSIVEILNRFFDLVTQRFRSSSVTDRWTDTCATFLAELEHAIEGYQI